jgi:NADH-quinone oxidoreductase subunit E
MNRELSLTCERGIRQPMTSEDEKIRLETTKILAEKGMGQTGLITLLQEIQAYFGYLPRQAMIEIAKLKGIPETRVYSVASFYNQFRFIPPGKYPIKVCLGTACHIKGGEAILRVWEKKLGITEGGVTPDRMFSLDRVACIGCCAIAPVTVVGQAIEARMMPTRVEGILLAVKLGKP